MNPDEKSSGLHLKKRASEDVKKIPIHGLNGKEMAARKDVGGGLNDKQERFCQEYMLTLNATQSAITAGYAPKTAAITASKLLTQTKVSARLADLRKENLQRSQCTADDVIREYQKIAFSNMQDYMHEGMTFEDIVKLKKEHAAAIESVSVDRKTTVVGEAKVVTETVKLKLHSKTHALDSLGRYFGIFEKDNKQARQVIRVTKK